MTKSLKLSEIKKRLSVDMDGGEILINDICTDSRELRANSIFVALKGERFDGHDFVLSALEGGALFAIVEKKYFDLYPESVRSKLIGVDDSLCALGSCANLYLEKFNLDIIAITGSVGKTTTKEYLKSVLGKKYNICASEKSFNNRVGVSKTIFNLSESDEVLILEMGINHTGEMDQLLEIARPNIGVITNVGRSHIGFFHNIETIAKEKAKLLHAIPGDGISFINYDDQYILNETKYINSRKIYFSPQNSKRAEFRLALYRIDENLAGDARFVFYDSEFDVELKYIGRHLAVDAMVAGAIGFELGVRIDSIKDALMEIQNLPMRMQIVRMGHTIIILDCYNANPESTLSLIETSRSIGGVKRTLLVMGDMLELGDDSPSLHFEIGVAARKSGIENILSIGSHGHDVLAGASLKEEERFCSSIEELDDRLCKIAYLYDLILIKGSRGMKMEHFGNSLIARGGK